MFSKIVTSLNFEFEKLNTIQKRAMIIIEITINISIGFLILYIFHQISKKYSFFIFNNLVKNAILELECDFLSISPMRGAYHRYMFLRPKLCLLGKISKLAKITIFIK